MFICQGDITDCMYLLKSAQSATPVYFNFNQLEENNQNSRSTQNNYIWKDTLHWSLQVVDIVWLSIYMYLNTAWRALELQNPLARRHFSPKFHRSSVCLCCIKIYIFLCSYFISFSCLFLFGDRPVRFRSLPPILIIIFFKQCRKSLLRHIC